jgi:16S rRNA (cytidine1402-2'-O)-methyltransferase
MELLAEGKNVAVVSEAGTPGISDPGFTLVRRAIEVGEQVTMTPGPAAVIMAVVLSGLPVHSFTYRGFPPHKGGPRRRFFQVDAHSPHTLVFYESPYRIEAFLRDALEVYGDRPAAIARELTKLHETIDRGTISELLTRTQQGKTRGEYVIVVGGAGRGAAGAVAEPAGAEDPDEEG